MSPRAIILFALSSLAASVFAQGGQRCGPDSPCPASAPCCSEYGFCGTDHFCLGGCNPLWSRRLDSCRPNPICKDATHTFPDLSRILSNHTLYDGNATAYDWVVEGGNALNTNQNGGELALILTKDNGGTKISSTRYVHYGKITARMKTGRWGGVVTAFITMSDAKDEIDFEWPGNAVTEAQLNYFWLGVANYTATHGSTVRDLTDTYNNFHDYTIDWQPDRLRFLIDGTEVRVIEKSSTTNAEAGGRLEYPTTPARVQLSLWPAGIDSSAQGTVEWAGGMINWNDNDYIANGQFQTIIQSVTIECYDNQNRPANASSYVYAANDTMGVPQVLTTNTTTLLNGAGSLHTGGLSIGLGVFAALLFSL